MKKFFYYTCLPLMVMGTFLATSCNDDEPSIDNEFRESTVYIGDALDINGRYIYSLTADELRLLRRQPDSYYKSWREEHPDEADNLLKEIKDRTMRYDNMRLLFHMTFSEKESSAYNNKQWDLISEYSDLVKKTETKLAASKELYELNLQRMLRGEELLSGCDVFFTARFNDRVCITANKKLFGMNPGEDLSTHFGVEGAANVLPQGLLTDYSILFEKFSTSRPTDLASFFAPDTWLMRNYMFWMKDMPEENYDEVTFTITLPVTCDCWYDYYAYGKSELKHENKVLTGSATVFFGQESGFEDDPRLLWTECSSPTLW